MTWYNNDFPHKRKITINSSYVSGSHTDFPILVTPSGLTGVASDGTDIVFTDDDESTRLHHEIDTFSLGTGNIWVKIPSFSEDSNKDIYIYYGDGSDHTDDAGYLPSGTWNNDFVYVNHMNDVDSTTLKDSSRWNNTPHKRVANKPIQTTFGVGSGQTFHNDGTCIVSSAAIDAYNLSAQMTVMVTARYDYPYDSYGYFFNLGHHGNYQDLSLYAAKTDNSNRVYLTTDKNTGGLSTFPVFNKGVTYYIAFTYQSGAGVAGNLGLFLYYMSGKLTNSHDGTWGGNLVFDQRNLNIGNRGDEARQFSGQIGEVRWLNKTKSHGWISTSYSSQVYPHLFYTLGEEEDVPVVESSDYTNFITPVGNATSWIWNSGQYNLDSGMRVSRTNHIWGKPDNAGSATSVACCRAMGGLSPNINSMKIKSMSVRVTTTDTPFRIGIYQGGSLTTGPADAWLVWDAGLAGEGDATAGWKTITNEGEDIFLSSNTPTWCAWKFSSSRGIYYNGSPDRKGFQYVRGRFLSNSMATGANSVWPDTWSAGGAFSNYWYNIYLTYEGPNHTLYDWGVISSSADYYYPSGSPTSWQWKSGSAYS